MAAKERSFKCDYKYCLHPGQKVKSSEAVRIHGKHYHMDCAVIRNDINECAEEYVDIIGDQDQFPFAVRVISILVFNNNVPIDFISKTIHQSPNYYKDKPVQALYGLRKLFWEKTFV